MMEEKEKRFQKQYKMFNDTPESIKQSVFRYLYDYEIRKKYPDFITDFSIYVKNCNSQIEMALAIAYIIVITKDKYDADNPLDYWGYHLEAQAEIEANSKKYYVDFLFDTSIQSHIFEKPYKLVIECDGHDYHHASKQQVQKDYERETNLKMAGYDVLRFTGSQIYKDPIGCAKTIFDYIKKKVGEEDG